MHDFGDEVRGFLRFHGFRQWELAREVGLDPAHFSKLLTGWFPLREQMRQRILAAMRRMAEGRNDD